ncbi:DUF2917 domain-containing protein [Sphaerotilus microaerophilus]|uniref:DUF2917 domain-containing protein n=1 Tax=Sphaerotilus microaerophilus TaxID=2914710 RepID=A0ABM7YGA6_9BURK|nr:DUF2917 domain-containing protein [Sphaerotilus sp. FB-5]BDI03611.1 hypothetical protein CATMQ487_05810 [Sphaerotilus sp. FB-5]
MDSHPHPTTAHNPRSAMSLTHPLQAPLPVPARRGTPAAAPRPDAESAGEPLTLARGATCTRRARTGSQLRVESGRAWITVSGDARDHFLTAGEHLPLPRGAVVVIEGDSSMPTRVCWR